MGRCATLRLSWMKARMKTAALREAPAPHLPPIRRMESTVTAAIASFLDTMRYAFQLFFLFDVVMVKNVRHTLTEL